MNKIERGFLLAIFFFFFTLLPVGSWAYQIEKISDTQVYGDIVLNQTKTEAQIDPGKSETRSVSLTNRSGIDLAITVSVEDFSASAKSEQNIDLLGEKNGIYSLKNYLKPEATSFILHHGEKINLPVKISIPENAQPGGLYGAVIFSAEPAALKNSSGAIKTVPRLASLFFVKVNGTATEQGELLDFSSSKLLYFSNLVSFEFNYKNSGNVYLNPYGELKVTDLLGREVYKKWLTPYFVMPGSIRQQIEKINNAPTWGMYQATLKLNRGYGNIIDQKSVYFIILPWRYALGFLGAVLIVGIIWAVIRKFKIRKKNETVA